MSLQRVSVDHVIVGGGIIGTAVGASLSYKLASLGRRSDIILLEKAPFLGDGSTSRNSEVIHAGIYYPTGSLKERLCIKAHVPFRKTGKWIVSVSENDDAYLMNLKEKMECLHIPAYFLSRKELDLEPFLKIRTGLSSPTSGIVDSHALLSYFESQFLKHDGLIFLNTKATRIDPCTTGFEVLARNEKTREEMLISTRTLVNAAGLHSDEVSSMLFDEPNYRIYPTRGYYYTLPNKYHGQRLVDRLIYPVPERNLTGLGIHATIDLSGRLRFGPNVEYGYENDHDDSITKAKEDFTCDYEGVSELERRKKFWRAIKRYLRIDESYFDKMAVDYVGIRSKLSSQLKPDFRDFVIKDERERGFPGFINLIGIESPGITASPAIAAMVVDELLKEYI